MVATTASVVVPAHKPAAAHRKRTNEVQLAMHRDGPHPQHHGQHSNICPKPKIWSRTARSGMVMAHAYNKLRPPAAPPKGRGQVQPKGIRYRRSTPPAQHWQQQQQQENLQYTTR